MDVGIAWQCRYGPVQLHILMWNLTNQHMIGELLAKGAGSYANLQYADLQQCNKPQQHSGAPASET